MPRKIVTASDREALIRLASSLPTGSEERRVILAAIKGAGEGASASVGDILVSSWGYDQTNVNFYEITRIISPSMVEIREIKKKILGTSEYDPDELISMHEDKVMPVRGAFYGPPLRKRLIKGYRPGQMGVKINSSEYAYTWNGKPQRQTAWGYGH